MKKPHVDTSDEK